MFTQVEWGKGCMGGKEGRLKVHSFKFVLSGLLLSLYWIEHSMLIVYNIINHNNVQLIHLNIYTVAHTLNEVYTTSLSLIRIGPIYLGGNGPMDH